MENIWFYNNQYHGVNMVSTRMVDGRLKVINVPIRDLDDALIYNVKEQAEYTHQVLFRLQTVIEDLPEDIRQTLLKRLSQEKPDTTRTIKEFEE